MTPATADHGDEADHGRLLDHGPPTGDGWAVWELAVQEDGTDVYLWRLAGDMRYPLHGGTALYTEQGELVSWGTFQGWRGEGVKVETGPAGVVHDTWEGERWGDFGLHTFVRDLDAGSYVLASWWAAGEATWSYDLHGDDVVLQGVTRGDSAFVNVTPSFDALVNGQLWLGGPLSSHVVLDGRTELAVENTLLFFGASRSSTPYFALETPEGTEFCRCTFFEAKGEGALGPGSYEVVVTSAGIGDLVAGGADVDLPFD